MNVHILVDYYNLPRRLLSRGISFITRQIDSCVLSVFPDTSETLFRLYGGWYDESGLSNNGTRLAQEINKNFPILLRRRDGKIRYLKCEIASSLIKVRSEIFSATVRQHRGMSWLFASAAPAECVDVVNCTAPVVREWSRRGCPAPACKVTARDVFYRKEQKLVDTLICCDLLTLAGHGKAMRVFLVSEDDDFIPALLLSGSHGAKVWQIRTKPSKTRRYDLMLQRQGVQFIYL